MWPRVRVLCADESVVLAALEALREGLGALPQADIIEPWDPGGDEPWELRVDLPGVSAAAIEQAAHALAMLPARVQWTAGAPAGVTESTDRHLRVAEFLRADGIEAVQWVDPEAGGSLTLDLARSAAVDPEVLELELELARALRTVDPGLAMRSDRGPDTVAAVVHRSSGRFGVEVVVGHEAFEGLDGDQVLGRRQAILGAVASVMGPRAEHPRLQLAPDVRFDLPLGGLSLLLWAIAPPVPALPGDWPVPMEDAGVAVQGLVDDVPGLVRELEVQVLPEPSASHEAVLAAVADTAEAGGWLGGRPRWLGGPQGPVFAPTWRVCAPQAATLWPAVEALQTHAEVRALRVVGAEPSGLEAAWPGCDPAWWVGRRRCWLRVRDGVRDRDHLERVDPRPCTDSDAALEAGWRGALESPEALGEVVPIVDRLGRPGLEARPGPGAVRWERLQPLLAASDALDEPHLCAMATWGFVTGQPRLRLWWRVPVPERPRVWRGQSPPTGSSGV